MEIKRNVDLGEVWVKLKGSVGNDTRHALPHHVRDNACLRTSAWHYANGKQESRSRMAPLWQVHLRSDALDGTIVRFRWYAEVGYR